eukprot:3857524-Rhodomonas_salina.1
MCERLWRVWRLCGVQRKMQCEAARRTTRMESAPELGSRAGANLRKRRRRKEQRQLRDSCGRG